MCCEDNYLDAGFFLDLDMTKLDYSTFLGRDVTTGATGATEVAPKFSDTLTLS